MWHICRVGDILALPLTLSRPGLSGLAMCSQHPNWPSPFPQGSHEAGNPGPLHKASWLLGSLEVNRLGAGGGNRGEHQPPGNTTPPRLSWSLPVTELTFTPMSFLRRSESCLPFLVTIYGDMTSVCSVPSPLIQFQNIPSPKSSPVPVSSHPLPPP